MTKTSKHSFRVTIVDPEESYCEFGAIQTKDSMPIMTLTKKNVSLSTIIKNFAYLSIGAYFFAKIIFLLYYDGVEVVIHCLQN